MNTSFKHSPLVHLLGTGGSVFFVWLAYRSSVDHFEHGGSVARIILVSACTILTICVLVLYLTSGVNRYEPTEEGLRVHRLLRTTFHPWSEVSRIDLNNSLHYIVIWGRERAIAYTSTDFFPRIIDLIRFVHDRSNCALPPLLTEILAANAPDKVA